MSIEVRHINKRFGDFQPGVDDVYGFFRRSDAALAFFLEAVKDKHCLSKLDGVHGPVSATNIVLHNFKHPCTTKALEHFGGIMLVACLCQRQSKAKQSPNLSRQGHQVFVAATDPFKRLFV